MVLSSGDEARAQPVFQRIARAVSDDILRARLRPGDVLPSSRALAVMLGVHRNTVLAAYRELGAEGWIETRAGDGTFVTATIPERRARSASRALGARQSMPPKTGFELPAPPTPWLGARAPTTLPRGTIALYSGVPDVSLVPVAALGRAYRRALRPGALGYGDARGDVALRTQLAAMVSSLRGLATTPDSVLVTRGSQQALDLVARALLRPGDVVAVEALGYTPAWAALAATGATLVPVRVDGAGLCVDALATLAAAQPLRAVYVTPHHQYPTTVTLSASRRLALLELARKQRFAILEDDYDYEFHYDGRPVLPLASTDRDGVVVYLGTLSKILSPALRLGFVVAPESLLERLAALRMANDRQGDTIVERAVAELLDEGEVQRHARRMRRIYEARRDVLVEALRRQLGRAIDFDVPAGGMALWVRAEGVDVEAWSARALDGGVATMAGKRFTFSGRPPAALRLGFAAHADDVLREAVRRLAAALRETRAHQPTRAGRRL